MTPEEVRLLEAFPAWLKTLAEDARLLAAIVKNRALADGARRPAALALSYLFKSLDLIPDGLEDLGFMDDAFVFRVAAASASDPASDATGALSRLGADTELVREFLGEVYPKLEDYVGTLSNLVARGRSVDDVLADEAIAGDFVREVRQWADGYEPPAFHRDPRNLVKLRAFLAARLTRA